MDEQGLPEEYLLPALRGLERINLFSGAVRALWPAIEREARLCGAPLRLLDVACGGGDVARALAAKAARKGVTLQIDGCDKNAVAVAYAQDAAQKQGLGERVRFFQHDIDEGALPEGYDIIMTSLFLHHLTTPRAIELLTEMSQRANKLLLVLDLMRTRLGLYLVYLGTGLLTRSPVVRQDGVTSLLAAFSMDEIRVLAKQADLYGASITKVWPERFLLTWRRPPEVQQSPLGRPLKSS